MGTCCSTGTWPPEGQPVIGEYEVSFISKRFDLRPINCTFAVTNTKGAFVDKRNDTVLMDFTLGSVDDALSLPVMNRLIITLKNKERFVLESTRINEIEEQIKFSRYMGSGDNSPFTKRFTSQLDHASASSPEV